MANLAERQGNWLETVYGRGYLLGKSDPYHLPGLREHADGLGFRLVTINTTGSTMPFVDHLAMKESGPVVVIADHQTRGVGRKDRIWHDTEGKSILMSVLLKLDSQDIQVAAVMSDLVALRTAQALSDVSGSDIRTKYPNDIVFEGKKTGGILVKNIFYGNEYIGTNVGIGINVHYANEELEAFKPDYPATSLDEVNGLRNKREDLVKVLLSGLRYSVADSTAITYNKADQERYNDIWREKSAVLGKDVCILSDNKSVAQGKVIDTRMGEGILLESNSERRWFNHFDTSMKVSIIE